MLADFSFTPAEQIFENLKKSGSMAGMAKPTGGATASMSKMSDAKMASMTSRHGRRGAGPQRRQI